MTAEAAPDSQLAVRPDSTVQQRDEPPTVSSELIVADMIRDVATMDGRDGQTLQRWSVRVPLYPKHQYLVKGASSKVGGSSDFDDDGGGGGTWMSDYSAAPRAEGYDWMNRVMGVQIWVPPTVHNRLGKEVPNPIHDGNYLYHRSIGIGYNDLGQLIATAADIELDFMKSWQQERLKKAQQLLRRNNGEQLLKLLRDDKTGAPLLTDDGNLQFSLPTKDEISCAQRLLTLQNFGGRQAETIARRRILTVMSGIRTLWSVNQAQKPELYTVLVNVVGYRDKMKSDERLAKAQETAKEVFGAPIRERGELMEEQAVEGHELADAEVDTAVEQTEAAYVVDTSPATEINVQPDREPEPQGVVQPTLMAMEGESIAKAEGVKPQRDRALQACAEVAPDQPEDEPREACMKLLNEDGRHKGGHASPTYRWPNPNALPDAE